MLDNKYRKYITGLFLRLQVFLGIIVYSGIGLGQDSISLERKSIKANRIEQIPVIDGIPDNGLWDQLPVATGFIQYDPYNGRKSVYETEIRFG
jgi:hypothetical protein